MTPTRPPRIMALRFGIIAAAVTGFAIGAAGFAAAMHSDSPAAAESPDTVSIARQVGTTGDDDGAGTTIDDRPGTTIHLTIPDPIDSRPSTTNTQPSTTDTQPSTTTNTQPSTTIGSSLPAPFTRSYSSAGGTVSVTWSGTALSLNAVSPAPGFRAEIEDQSWDRVRVDFEGHDHDARIEVRIDDGQLRIRID